MGLLWRGAFHRRGLPSMLPDHSNVLVGGYIRAVNVYKSNTNEPRVQQFPLRFLWVPGYLALCSAPQGKSLQSHEVTHALLSIV